MDAAAHCPETPGTQDPVWRARLETGLVFVFAWSLVEEAERGWLMAV